MSRVEQLRILCVGLNHQTAPLELRERVALSGEQLAAAFAEVSSLPEVEQAAVLSTCNRTEVYTASFCDVSSQVREWFIACAGTDADLLTPHLYEMAGAAAAAHACCVAAGIDSQIVGESEILGQVRRAADAAREAGTLGPELEKMLSAAINAGKRARTETGIGKGAFSVGRCAVDTARAVLGALRGRTVLILGAGEIAESTVRHLRDQGADTILVANRTFSSAQQLARLLGGRAVRYDQLPTALLEADVVIASTSAPHFVLLREHVAEAMAVRGGRNLLLIDIAVPRDIDPEVTEIPGVHLRDIDDLGDGVESAATCRAAEVEAAKTIARETAGEFCHWMAAREAVPLMSALRAHFEAARQEQMARFAARVERLAPADRELVHAVTRSLVNRLLHDPVVNLKHELAVGNGKVADSVVRIFNLSVGRRWADVHLERAQLSPRDERDDTERSAHHAGRRVSERAPEAGPAVAGGKDRL